MRSLIKNMHACCRSAVRNIVRDEEGVTVVEIILITIVLISLVVIFKSQLTSLVKTILKTLANNAKSV